MSAKIIPFPNKALLRYQQWYVQEFAIRAGDFWVDQIDMDWHERYQRTEEFRRLNARTIAEGKSVTEMIRKHKESK